LPQEKFWAASHLTMPTSCPQCHTEMPDNVVFCTHCGRRMWIPGQAVVSAASVRTPTTITVGEAPENDTVTPTPGSSKDNVVAALAYVSFFPAVIFLSVSPFKKSRFVRFHSWQSILLTLATILAGALMRLLYSFLALIPFVGFLLAWLVCGVSLLGWCILWLVLVIKALQGEALRLPVIGTIADKL
jgi:uncharacterized membrane protein